MASFKKSHPSKLNKIYINMAITPQNHSLPLEVEKNHREGRKMAHTEAGEQGLDSSTVSK